MSGPDRRHAVGVARETIRLLEVDARRREVTAAALLHDVGKVESRLGTFARAGITAAALVFGRTRVRHWASGSATGGALGYRARIHSYLGHDQVGAELLGRAGSEELTCCWAREHHQPPEAWSIDRVIGAALKAADDD